jgi:molybdate transport system regulatory protein
MARLHLRIDFGAAGRIGPGKVALLERVAEVGSISAAARTFDMSYRRAWLLVDAMNRTFAQPVVATVKGGHAHGGATLTPFGLELIKRYRRMEATAATAMAEDVQALEAALASTVAGSAVAG